MTLLWQTKRSRKKVNRRIQPKVRASHSRVLPGNINLRWAILMTVSLLLLVISYVLWVKLTNPQTLPLRQVELEATFRHVSKQELHEVVKMHAKGGFFSVDVDAVTEAVTALPWVDTAKVYLVWPDTVHVTVNEQVAMARWGDQALVNVRGELFYPAEESVVDLVELSGPDTSVKQMTAQFNAFNRMLEASRLKVKRIHLSQRRAWELELDNGTVILLGRHDIETRIRHFVRFYPQLLAGTNEVKRIDMRYTNGFAVQWNV